MLSYLWDGAYKRLTANQNKVVHVGAAGFLSRYLSDPLPYVRRHITVNTNVSSASLNKTIPSFPSKLYQQQTLCSRQLFTLGREREIFYLTTHSTHFIYGYMASDIWLRNILIVRKQTRCRHIGYSFRLAARVILYAPSHRQGSTYHGLCYTSRGALAGTRNSSMGPPHEGSIRRSIAP